MRHRWPIALLLAGTFACFAHLGEAPVYDLNEAREGVYVRAMLATRSFVLPVTPYHRENGELVMDKPPLFHWIAAIQTAAHAAIVTRRLPSGKELAAAFDEWDLRFPSALAGMLTLAAVALLGRALIGERGGLLAAATLLASGQFEYQSHLGRVDMCFTASVALTMLLAGRAMITGSRRAIVLAGAASALAVLSKGPLGIVLPLFACAAYVLWSSVASGSASRLPALPWGRAALICLALTLPWYVAAWRIGGRAFVNSNILDENVGQFIGSNGRMPFFGYVLPWLLDTLPWNLFAVYGAWKALRTREAGAAFCAVWWLSTLFVFQLAAYKRRAYLLPAAPAGALLAGWVLDSWLSGDARGRSAETLRALVAWVAAAVALGGIVTALTPEHWLAFHVAGAPVARIDAQLAMTGIVVAVTGLAVLAATWQRRAGMAIGALLVSFAAIHVAVVPVERTTRAKAAAIPTLVSRIEKEMPTGAGLTIAGIRDDPPLPLLLYARAPERWSIRRAADLRAHIAPGWYLLSRQTRKIVSARAAGDGERCDELFRVKLRERGATTDLMLLHLTAGMTRASPG